jgi:hypothetical protein
MRKKTFSEEQIALALRDAQTGTPATEVCRKMGVSEQSFYRGNVDQLYHHLFADYRITGGLLPENIACCKTRNSDDRPEPMIGEGKNRLTLPIRFQ